MERFTEFVNLCASICLFSSSFLSLCDRLACVGSCAKCAWMFSSLCGYILRTALSLSQVVHQVVASAAERERQRRENGRALAGHVTTSGSHDRSPSTARCGKPASGRSSDCTDSSRVSVQPDHRSKSGKDEDWSSWAGVTTAFCGDLGTRLLEAMDEVALRGATRGRTEEVVRDLLLIGGARRRTRADGLELAPLACTHQRAQSCVKIAGDSWCRSSHRVER